MDKLIIGAGLYGLYAALYCGKRGQQVEVLEIEQAPFTRATYINQARVHMGYHYPRSLSTAMKSAGYFKRFVEDYSFCIHTKFEQIYATSSHFSWTDATEFRKFCQDAGIPCKTLPVEEYFQPGLCDGAFLTEEYTYDAHILRDYLMEEIAKYPGTGNLAPITILAARHIAISSTKSSIPLCHNTCFIVMSRYHYRHLHDKIQTICQKGVKTLRGQVYGISTRQSRLFISNLVYT